MADGGDGGAGGGEGPLRFSKMHISTVSSQERPVKILTAPL